MNTTSRPILFSAPMVRAILDGTKTQTRRIINPQPDHIEWFEHQKGWLGSFGNDAGSFKNPHRMVPCPYGQVGDQLWVREEHYQFGHWMPVEGVRTKTGRQKWKFVADSDEVRYMSNPPAAFRKGMHNESPDYVMWHKRLARFMPRKFSRITLEITEIRVERLQAISKADAIAEGIERDGESWKSYETILEGPHKGKPHPHSVVPNKSPVTSYMELWESINGLNTWTQNPFVWAITFTTSIK